MSKTRDSSVAVVAAGKTFTFSARSIEGFEEATGFLAGLLERNGVSPAIAVYYVKLAARLKRQRRLFDPAGIVHKVERTAANAYWKWINEGYDTRVSPVLRAFAKADVTRGVRWLRRGSLVPPHPGKVLYRRLLPVPPKMGEQPRIQNTIAEDPCPDKWTLHVPLKEGTPTHTDPCPDCAYVEVSPVQLEIVAKAFEQAWGHRQLDGVPPEAFLFGQPPIVVREKIQESAAPKIAGLVQNEALTHVIDQIGGSTTPQVDVFVARVQNAQVALIDFAVVPADDVSRVLAAVHEAFLHWSGKEAKPAPPVTAMPTWGPLPGAPTSAAPIAWDALKVEPPVEVEPEPPVEVEPEPPAEDAELDIVVPPVEPEAEPEPLAAAPSIALVPADPTAEPDFVPTDWEAVGARYNTKLVHCTLHRTQHSVRTSAVPCAAGAWTDIQT